MTVRIDARRLGGAMALGFTLAAGSLARGQGESPAPQFLRGDANSDGWVSMADALMIRRYLFSGRQAPACLDAADADDGGGINIIDSLRILLSFFPNRRADWGLTEIAAPYPEWGLDSTPDDDGVELGCASTAIEAAESTQDLIRIGTVEAGPGEEVSVPVLLTNAVEVEAIQLVIQYDPSVFTPHSGSLHNDQTFDLAGTFYEILLGPDDPHWFASLQAHPEDGLFTIGIVSNLIWEGWEVPAGNETLLFRFKGTVSASAQPGTSIVLEPTNGPDGQGVKPPLRMRNELTHQGQSRLATTLPRTEAGLIGIVDDVTFFLRGDSNGDAEVNISDPIFTLSYLYLGGDAPVCPDAADADDNGALEVTDAIAVLSFLFDGTTTLPAPRLVPGGDPTPDSLARCRR